MDRPAHPDSAHDAALNGRYFAPAPKHAPDFDAYVLCHDLRSPLRAIAGFVELLKEDCGDRLVESELDYLARIRAAVERMEKLISAMMRLGQAGSSALVTRSIDLSAMASGIRAELLAGSERAQVEFSIAPNLFDEADPVLIHTVLHNLLANAWKYTSKREQAVIEFGRIEGNPAVYFVRDNGVGFDMAHAHRLFAPFQRLHTENEFPGSGLGLASVERIVRRHGGEAWAEADPEKGATVYFTLKGPCTNSAGCDRGPATRRGARDKAPG
jgi:light-regulated signal transduction histidine kinase (bacteriophytochrome)